MKYAIITTRKLDRNGNSVYTGVWNGKRGKQYGDGSTAFECHQLAALEVMDKHYPSFDLSMFDSVELNDNQYAHVWDDLE